MFTGGVEEQEGERGRERERKRDVLTKDQSVDRPLEASSSACCICSNSTLVASMVGDSRHSCSPTISHVSYQPAMSHIHQKGVSCLTKVCHVSHTPERRATIPHRLLAYAPHRLLAYAGAFKAHAHAGRDARDETREG